MGEHCGDGRVLCCDCGGSKNEIHEINCMEVHTHTDSLNTQYNWSNLHKLDALQVSIHWF